ncbi:septum site-determining protein MinC [Anaerobacillus sp. MEB173]|uniref:septum site-determining protein MinC n=1 Tax=Anaerobacillus sp. MEB173 TaxID=3383345 RepID=UPI003F8ECED9
MGQKQHFVTIKGTKDGLIFLLDDSSSFQSLLEELEDKLSTKYHQLFEGPTVSVKVKVGNRYLTIDQESQLRHLIEKTKSMHVESIESNVMTKAEAEEIRKDSQVVSVAKIIRSGQVLEVKGDLLLLGDVNPGGIVVATGNIYVMGALRGIAHAGVEGNEEAIISAALMAPSQLKIADTLSRFHEQDEVVEGPMEYAYIDRRNENERIIATDRVQQISRLRTYITRL